MRVGAAFLNGVLVDGLPTSAVTPAHPYPFGPRDYGLSGKSAWLLTAALNYFHESKFSTEKAAAYVEWYMARAHRGPLIAPPAPQAAPRAEVTASSEIAAIEGRMQRDRRGYFRDTAMQSRYRELISARDGA